MGNSQLAGNHHPLISNNAIYLLQSRINPPATIETPPVALLTQA